MNSVEELIEKLSAECRADIACPKCQEEKRALAAMLRLCMEQRYTEGTGRSEWITWPERVAEYDAALLAAAKEATK